MSVLDEGWRELIERMDMVDEFRIPYTMEVEAYRCVVGRVFHVWRASALIR